MTSWKEMLRVTSAFTPQKTLKSSVTLEQSYRKSTAGSSRSSQVSTLRLLQVKARMWMSKLALS